MGPSTKAILKSYSNLIQLKSARAALRIECTCNVIGVKKKSTQKECYAKIKKQYFSARDGFEPTSIHALVHISWLQSLVSKSPLEYEEMVSWLGHWHWCWKCRTSVKGDYDAWLVTIVLGVSKLQLLIVNTRKNSDFSEPRTLFT